MLQRITSLSALAVGFAVASQAQAQQLSGFELDPVLIEGDAAPGAQGFTVGSIDNPSSNGIGGWAIGYTSESGPGNIDRVFGTVDGVAAPADVFIQGIYGGLEQGPYEFTVGFGDTGTAVYSPSIPSLGSSVDSAWFNEFPIAIEGDPIINLPGTVWRFASRPGAIDSSNEPVFIGGINDSVGASIGNGLFRGFSPSPVLIPGDVIAGFPAPLAMGSAVDFDFRYSYDGTQLVTPVDLEGLPAGADLHLSVNGGPMTIGGLLVFEDGPLPASLQAEAEERWDSFDFFGILDDGTWFFNGDTTADSAVDEFIVRGQEIVLREGDPAGSGLTYSGSIESLTINRSGDLAYVWDVTDGDEEALGFNGRVLAKENDRADLDGDGVEDATLLGFVGLNSLALTTEREVVFTADFLRDGDPTAVEVAALLSVPDLLASEETLSLAAGGQVDFTLFTRPEVTADFYWLLGSLSGTAPGLPFGPGLTLPLNIDALFNLGLNNANTPPFANNFASPDTLGVGDASFSLPAGTNPALGGLTANFAYATIDVLSLNVSSVSNAVEVEFLP